MNENKDRKERRNILVKVPIPRELFKGVSRHIYHVWSKMRLVRILGG